MVTDWKCCRFQMKGYARQGMLSQLPNLVADMQLEVTFLTRLYLPITLRASAPSFRMCFDQQRL